MPRHAKARQRTLHQRLNPPKQSLHGASVNLDLLRGSKPHVSQSYHNPSLHLESHVRQRSRVPLRHSFLRSMAAGERIGVDELGRRDRRRHRPSRPSNRRRMRRFARSVGYGMLRRRSRSTPSRNRRSLWTAAARAATHPVRSLRATWFVICPLLPTSGCDGSVHSVKWTNLRTTSGGGGGYARWRPRRLHPFASPV